MDSETKQKKNECEKKNGEPGFEVVDDDDDENCLAFLNRRIRESKNITGNWEQKVVKLHLHLVRYLPSVHSARAT